MSSVTVEVTKEQYEFPAFSIGVAAHETGLHQQTLRAYEAKGLISPHRTAGGTRLYSMRDVDDIRRIAALSNEGVGVAGIIEIFRLERENERLKSENARLRNKVMELDGEPSELMIVPKVRWLMVL